jgi:TolQ protein
MHALSFCSTAGRWQARLRLFALLLLLGATLAGGSLVFAQSETGGALSDAAALAPAVVGEPAGEPFGVKQMFAQADWVVKGVMIFLVFCSLVTWAVLFEKLVVFGRARKANRLFLEAFRKGDTQRLHEQAEASAMGRMWQVAQAELTRFGRQGGAPASADRINRLLQRMSLNASIVQERDLARLGSMMGVLATIGATAPFIGLFGTVWGILNSFASIATMKSASLAIVAPGIAEALLATALGLFAAIPAVMIFNKFARDINGFVGSLDNFTAEMIASTSRQLDEAH